MDRDQYFLDLYEKAAQNARENSLAKIKKGSKPIIGAEDIDAELKILLAEELSIDDFEEETNRVMYHYAYYLERTLFRPELLDDASDQEIEDFARYKSKFAAIQQTLVTYTLGENDSPNAIVALRRWREYPEGQVDQLTTFCKHYQSDLKAIVHNLEYSFFRFGNINNKLENPVLNEAREKLISVNILLVALQSNETSNDYKIQIFKNLYQCSAINKPHEKVKGSLSDFYARSFSTIFRKSINTRIQEFKMQVSERENVSGIDNIVSHENTPSLK
ncbi:MAG: hypothetical protein P1U74_09340 [Legionellaceae bacterium]|nr:hypothetical protein [Legionellaceae bacterium]